MRVLLDRIEIFMFITVGVGIGFILCENLIGKEYKHHIKVLTEAYNTLDEEHGDYLQICADMAVECVETKTKYLEQLINQKPLRIECNGCIDSETLEEIFFIEDDPGLEVYQTCNPQTGVCG